METAHATTILCDNPADRDAQMAYATRMAERLQRELRGFYAGDIQIVVGKKLHTMGWSVYADLVVAGEVCRHYDPADLCFLEVNELIMAQIQRTRGEPHGDGDLE